MIDPAGSSNSSVAQQDVGLLNIKETSAQYFSGVVYIVYIDSTLKSLVLDRQIYMSLMVKVRGQKKMAIT